MGMFDDLMPESAVGTAKEPAARKGMFDDLMPATKAAAAQPVEEGDSFVNTAAGFGRGLAKGVIGAPGLIGDLANIPIYAGDWARGRGYLPPIPKGRMFSGKFPGSQDAIEAAKRYVPALR